MAGIPLTIDLCMSPSKISKSTSTLKPKETTPTVFRSPGLVPNNLSSQEIEELALVSTNISVIFPLLSSLNLIFFVLGSSSTRTPPPSSTTGREQIPSTSRAFSIFFYIYI
ncbi:hypothetical protein ES288_A01G212200v1 [Gossypium darwinii]|uniref:Uncharacterized protein n=1 Tax=Gossypium darwinii TaxID=34276 RepID=A0A5D2HQJ2_GOSDA|nr:hypothetical protein ES288_A01G212200v1 [Gossypium darwinii]